MSNQEKKSGKRHHNVALRYTGMAFQMAVVIGLGVFIGKKLDVYMENERSIMTALCAFIGLGIAFYQILKDVNRGWTKLDFLELS